MCLFCFQVLTKSNAVGHSYTLSLPTFADHVNRWKNVSYFREPMGIIGFLDGRPGEELLLTVQ